MERTRIDAFLRLLRTHSNGLTRQQIKTLRGQALTGDVDGAEKGLRKIIERRTA